MKSETGKTQMKTIAELRLFSKVDIWCVDANMHALTKNVSPRVCLKQVISILGNLPLSERKSDENGR